MKASILMYIASVATSQAAIVQMYKYRNCEGDAQERNVWDNTCAPTDEFWSYRITYNGASDQYIRAYCEHNCGSTGPNSCKVARASGECFNAVTGCGSSHALGSSAWEC